MERFPCAEVARTNKNQRSRPCYFPFCFRHWRRVPFFVSHNDSTFRRKHNSRWLGYFFHIVAKNALGLKAISPPPQKHTHTSSRAFSTISWPRTDDEWRWMTMVASARWLYPSTPGQSRRSVPRQGYLKISSHSATCIGAYMNLFTFFRPSFSTLSYLQTKNICTPHPHTRHGWIVLHQCFYSSCLFIPIWYKLLLHCYPENNTSSPQPRFFMTFHDSGWGPSSFKEYISSTMWCWPLFLPSARKASLCLSAPRLLCFFRHPCLNPCLRK